MPEGRSWRITSTGISIGYSPASIRQCPSKMIGRASVARTLAKASGEEALVVQHRPPAQIFGSDAAAPPARPLRSASVGWPVCGRRLRRRHIGRSSSFCRRPRVRRRQQPLPSDCEPKCHATANRFESLFRQLADRLGRCALEHAHALQIIEFDCRLDVTNEQEVDDFDRALCGGLERREFGFAIDRPFSPSGEPDHQGSWPDAWPPRLPHW